MPAAIEQCWIHRSAAPLISLRSKWRLTGFSRRFTPKNPVRLHKPSGQLPRWGAKNVLPLNLIALPLRGTSFQRKKGECRLPYSKAFFPASSFRAKARNLFRLRSGETAREAGNGKHASCDLGSTVFHADGFTKENGNGKRKRSLGCARDDETRKRLFPFLFNLLRKPTPPCCARQPLPREGARVDTPSFLWKEGVCRLTDFPRRRLTIRECRFPHIVISSESEKSFSFAVRQRM